MINQNPELFAFSCWFVSGWAGLVLGLWCNYRDLEKKDQEKRRVKKDMEERHQLMLDKGYLYSKDRGIYHCRALVFSEEYVMTCPKKDLYAL